MLHRDLVRGYAQFDCFGAGQRATRLFADASVRDEAFLTMRRIHELLFLLTEATTLCPGSATELRARLAEEIAALDALPFSSIEEVRRIDVAVHEALAHGLLREVGAAVGGVRARVRLVTAAP